jgi:hypothetical protein
MVLGMKERLGGKDSRDEKSNEIKFQKGSLQISYCVEWILIALMRNESFISPREKGIAETWLTEERERTGRRVGVEFYDQFNCERVLKAFHSEKDRQPFSSEKHCSK